MSSASLPSRPPEGSFNALQRLYDEQSTTVLENGVRSGLELLDQISAFLNVAKSQNETIERWIRSIESLRKEATPRKTVVGVVGSTGAGKSSVINALLDEEVLVPTNSMRACTSVVVEIHYNESPDEDEPYRAEVQFLSEEEWEKELDVHIHELYDDDNKLHRNHSDPDNPAGVAYAQIRAVYPMLSQEDLRQNRLRAKELAAHSSIKDVLGKSKSMSAQNARDLYNQVKVFVDSEKKSSRKSKTTKEPEPSQMQHWPLTKQVRIFARSPILKPDLVLVDLPGTGDNNAARGAVASKYLQKCDVLWVVAPITRAVDERAAQKLMNDNFRKQLHLDGTYGNITFICSKTDDISPREILRELKDSEDSPELSAEIQAREDDQREIEQLEAELEDMEEAIKSNSWQITHLSAEIKKLDGNIAAFEAALKDPPDQSDKVVVHLSTSYLTAGGKRKTPMKDSGSPKKKTRNCKPDDDYVDDSDGADTGDDHESTKGSDTAGVPMTRAEAKGELVKNRQNKAKADEERIDLQFTRTQFMEELSARKNKLKARESTLSLWCIRHRNNWSRPQIKRQFAQGMQDMEEEDLAQLDDDGETPAIGKLDSEKIEEALKVFCVSSRAYQNLHRRLQVGGRSLQKVSAFHGVEETEIPQLQEHAKTCAGLIRAATCRSFLKRIGHILGSLALHVDIIENARLLADNDQQSELDNLEKTSNKLEKRLKKTSQVLELSLHHILDSSITSRLEKSIRRAKIKAPIIAAEWGGSKESPGKCYWSTYRATCTRGGAFVGVRAPHDFNADLAGPFIAHACAPWKKTFEASFPAALARYSAAMERHVENFEKSMRARPQLQDAQAVHNQMENFKNRMKESTRIAAILAAARRDSHRGIIPIIKAEMASIYRQCGMEKGRGCFNRMRSTMSDSIQQVIPGMYQKSADAMSDSLKQAVDVIIELVDRNIEEAMLEIRGNYSTLITRTNPFADIGTKEELCSLLATADDFFHVDERRSQEP